MAIYLHHTTIARDELTVRFGGTGEEFVIIELDEHTSLSLHSAAEADELIRAGAEAKRLLLGETDGGTSPKAEAATAPVRHDAAAPQTFTPGGLAVCGDRKLGVSGVRCTRAQGHAGGHTKHGPGGSVEHYWPQDEAAKAGA